MKIIARFIDEEGHTVAKGTGKDWERALDKAYTKVMKVETKKRGFIQFEFKK